MRKISSGDLVLSERMIFLWEENENKNAILPQLIKGNILLLVLSNDRLAGDKIGIYIKVLTQDGKIGWIDKCQAQKIFYQKSS